MTKISEVQILSEVLDQKKREIKKKMQKTNPKNDMVKWKWRDKIKKIHHKKALVCHGRPTPETDIRLVKMKRLHIRQWPLRPFWIAHMPSNTICNSIWIYYIQPVNWHNVSPILQSIWPSSKIMKPLHWFAL